MDFSDCIKAMMKSCRMTQADLAAKSKTYQQAISNAFKRNNTEVRTLVKWCDLCGYEVVIQPKNIRGKRPEGQFVIDSAGKTAVDGEAEVEKKSARKKTSSTSGDNDAE